jgi:polyphosphate kinase
MTQADFLKAPFPAPVALSEAETTGPRRFFNRELSWLAFNWRVLEEAGNPAVPLLERMRFLSISATNLDEFYTVRVAGLRALVRNGNAAHSEDGRSPAEQLALIHADARALMQAQQSTFKAIRKEMEAAGIDLVSRSKLTARDQKFLESHFLTNVFPVLSPLAIDPAHPFPFIPNTGFSLALELERRSDRRPLKALLPIPQQIARFVRLPGKDRFLPLEELLLLHLDMLFPGYTDQGHCLFRVLRDSDLGGRGRGRRPGARIRGGAEAPPPRRGDPPEDERGRPRRPAQADHGRAARHRIRGGRGQGPAGHRRPEGTGAVLAPRSLWPPFTPRVPERVQDHEGDMFAAIKQKDILLHHPYETFDLVIRFLEQAARDPNVLAIKQTLYRTSWDSPVVTALCEAAEAGKSVTALVELKARFDEAANIRQSRRLERAGAHVVYGFMHLKTHAKISTVVRREGDTLVTYTHYGTGNYHPITARIYTDLSFFTCDAALGRDATKVFNYLSGYVQPEGLENLAISPITLKPRLLDLIAAEADHARAGRPAEIWAKMNSLIDPEVIDALYAASRAGVKISLVIRGICGVRPGVKGLSENIRVKSIVGRFLEHSRIVCFANGHGLPSRQARVFFSSADWMGRNLTRRVETLVEALNPTVKSQIMGQIMAANLADESQSWVLSADGTYRRELAAGDGQLFSCHRFFMENPSLSGRGTAGAKDVPRLAVPREDGPARAAE